jgi:hypothetical protein
MIAEDARMALRYLTTLFLLGGAFVHLLGQERFPDLSGETVEGARIVLPQANASPFTIVGLAYGQKAGPLLEEWYGPAYLRFVAKHGLFAAAYDARAFANSAKAPTPLSWTTCSSPRMNSLRCNKPWA